jgi:membrane-bound lytic murein transglycosylase B
MRLLISAVLAMLAVHFSSLPTQAATPFETWLEGARADALKQGIRAATLDEAFKDLKPIPRVVELDRKQPEFTLTFKQYLSRVVNDRRARKGKRMMEKHAALLDEVSAKYGVQKRFIVALWGIETDFGGITGGFPVIASLATLAHDGRRSKFFRKEMMLALKIIDQGHIAAKDMIGSWAGAMGQNQFMPSSFHNFAVDYNGDGAKDIWHNQPDVFGSIANYLKRSGWRDDLTWGRLVSLPKGFPKSKTGRKLRKPLSEWQHLGVRKIDGSDLPSRDIKGAIVLPAKKRMSPAYMAYGNFNVILKWNRSDYFAVAVGTLSDRLNTR